MRGPACFSIFIRMNEESNRLGLSDFFVVQWQGVSGRYPSGQRGQTVNLLPSASKVRILACPPKLDVGKF